MRHKIILIVAVNIAIFFGLYSCVKATGVDSIGEGDSCYLEDARELEFLNTIILGLESSELHSEVLEYQYKGETVFYINPCTKNCSDMLNTVYDCSGNQICMFGGIAGFNTCPDFEKSAKLTKKIFSK